jgi:4-hydroxy-3-methylbut-2-enyl diphosphate reductase
VRKAWEEGKQFIIAGSPHHPEVIGINGEARDTAVILHSGQTRPKNTGFSDQEWI